MSEYEYLKLNPSLKIYHKIIDKHLPKSPKNKPKKEQTPKEPPQNELPKKTKSKKISKKTIKAKIGKILL